MRRCCRWKHAWSCNRLASAAVAEPQLPVPPQAQEAKVQKMMEEKQAAEAAAKKAAAEQAAAEAKALAAQKVLPWLSGPILLHFALPSIPQT